jgi:hypothetical protein
VKGRPLLGLAAVSIVITMAVCEPPPVGLNKTAYLLVLSGAFFAGVTQAPQHLCVRLARRCRRPHGGFTVSVILLTAPR